MDCWNAGVAGKPDRRGNAATPGTRRSGEQHDERPRSAAQRKIHHDHPQEKYARDPDLDCAQDVRERVRR